MFRTLLLLVSASPIFVGDAEVSCRLHVLSSHWYSFENLDLILKREDGREKPVRTDTQGNLSVILAAGTWTVSGRGFVSTKFSTSACEDEIVLLLLNPGRLHDISYSLELEIKGIPSTKGQVFARLTHLVSGESQAAIVDPKKALARFPGAHDGYYSMALFDELGPVGQQILLVYEMDGRRKASLEGVPFYIKRGKRDRRPLP